MDSRGAVGAGAIITGLVALILVYSLAPTIITTSENAADTITTTENLGMADNAGWEGSTSPAALFQLGPLFWALVGIGVAAAIVIGALKTNA